jgi:signal transduction histidine kinase
VIAGVLAVFGLLNAAQLWVGIRSEGPGGVALEVSFGRLLGWQLGQWVLWGAFAPAILRLGERFPLPRPHPTIWLAHLAASVACAAIHIAASTLLLRWLDPFASGDPRPFGEHFVGRLTSVFHVDLLIYAAILGAGHAATYYRRYRERELDAARLEAQLARAQVEALRLQLQPHFLFNTLNAVSGLVRDDRGPAAVDMIAGLSELLRYSLATVGRPKVTLEEELAMAGRYLEIQQARFGDRLTVELSIAPGAGEALVPALLLQPLVENAVRHGVARIHHQGRVRIAAAGRDGRLRLEVADNGPGLAMPGGDEGVEGVAGYDPGVGLGTTRARLDQLYGDAHRFSLEPAAGGGTVAVVELPFERAVEATPERPPEASGA